MNQPAHASPGSATDFFFTYGQYGLELDRAMERRHAEAWQDQVNAALPASVPFWRVRRSLGASMVRLGARIAGTTTTQKPGQADPATVL